jgi:hypothetical protein
MKKQLLFGLTAFASLATVAQNPYRTIANAKVKKMETMKFVPAEPSIFNISTASHANVANKVSAAPYKRISGSFNLYGTIISESRCLQYNEAINTVGLAYRQNFNTWTGIPNANSGTISYAWSSNNGTSWDSTVLAANLTNLHRYPAGAMYNPAGNTISSNAYGVVVGPITVSAGGWQGNYFASKKLIAPGTNSNSAVVYADNTALTSTQRKQDLTRIDPQTTTDGVFHILGQLFGNINAGTGVDPLFRGAMINKGIFNAGTFTWTVDSLKPNFKLDNTGAISGSSSINMAWNEAGTTGYVIFYGVDANATAGTSQNSFQPYVYKTINSGTSWSRFAPLFDFTTIPVISNRLFGVHNTALAKPFISSSEGGTATVDAAGNLHLFCSLSSAASDNLDSLNYTLSPNYNQVWNYLMDFKTTSTGWDAMLVDSLSNAGPTATQSNWSASTAAGGPVAYDARCQISRTTDGNNIIYSWADSDSASVNAHASTLPDVYMKGYDVVANKMTCKKNMTIGKASIASQAFFFFASPIIAKPTSTSFLIPMSVVRSDDGSYNAETAISQYYIDDNTFAASEFTVTPNGPGCVSNTGVGINELASTVSDLNFYPNPASSNGTIEVSLVENAKMDIVVMNSVGQTVYTSSFEGTSGHNKVDINLSNLSAGLYFYQVKIANSKSVTKKFVVQK